MATAVSFPSLQCRRHHSFQSRCIPFRLLLRNAASQQQNSPPAKAPRGISSFCSQVPLSMRLLHHSSWESRLSLVATSERSSRSRAKNSESQTFQKRARRGIGNMPAQYAEFLKPPKESPNYVPWALGLLFLWVMRKTIITELQRWVDGLVLLFDFSKYGLDWLLKNAEQPIARILTIVGWFWFVVTEIYAFILDCTPVKALVNTILFSTAVLSLGEAVQPDILARQSVALDIASMLGLAGVFQLLDPTLFTLALAFLTLYLAVFKKAGLVGAALPAAAVLVAVAAPMVQALAFSVFLAMTLYSNWTQREPKKEMGIEQRKSPRVLKVFALAVGIRVAAEWLYARHIVWVAA